MHTLKLTRTHQVGNSCRYLNLIDCRRGFARPPRSVRYYGKFPTFTLISGLPVHLHKYHQLDRRDGPKQDFGRLVSCDNKLMNWFAQWLTLEEKQRRCCRSHLSLGPIARSTESSSLISSFSKRRGGTDQGRQRHEVQLGLRSLDLRVHRRPSLTGAR